MIEGFRNLNADLESIINKTKLLNNTKTTDKDKDTDKKKISATSVFYESLPYKIKEDGYIDYDNLEELDRFDARCRLSPGKIP